MRYWTIALLLVLIGGCASPQNEPASAICLSTDPGLRHALYLLNDDPVVQKAVDRHELGVIDAEAEYRKALSATESQARIDALMIERTNRLNALKAECVAALRRAEEVDKSLNENEEAVKIAALADRIASSSDNKRLTDTDYFGLHARYQDVPPVTDFLWLQ